MSQEFRCKKGLVVDGNANVSGSVTAPNFIGTASVSTFPFSASNNNASYPGVDISVNTANPGGTVTIGGLRVLPSSYAGMWLATDNPTSANYAFLGASQQTFFNVPDLGVADLEFRVGNTTHFQVGKEGAQINGPNSEPPTDPLTILDGTKTNLLLTLDDNGNLKLRGQLTASGITASLLRGTASWANNTLNALTAAVATTTVSSSYALQAAQSSPWYNQIANVKDYGARGDGTVDDTDAIQRAINSGRPNVYFPAGAYLLLQTRQTLLNITQSTNLFGDGFNSIMYVGYGVPATSSIITITPPANGQIYGMTIKDLAIIPADLGIGNNTAISCFATTSNSQFVKFTLDHVQINVGSASAFYASSSHSDAIYAITIKDSILYGGITLLDVGDNIIIDNNLISGGNHGIFATIAPGAGSLTIHQNNISAKKGMIIVDTGARTKIYNNNIEQQVPITSSHSSLIELRGRSNDVLTTMEIHGNTIRANANTAVANLIYMDYVNGVYITDNSLDRSNNISGYPIFATANTSQATIRGNWRGIDGISSNPDTGSLSNIIYDDVVNVKDQGALGDGASDDYRSISASLSILSTRSNGATLYFPHGNYKITNTLRVPENVKIVGSGINNTHLYNYGSNYVFNFGANDPSGNTIFFHTHISDMSIHGIGTPLGGVYMDGNDTFLLQNLHLSDFVSGSGLYLYGNNYIGKIDHVSCRRNNIGINIQKPSGNNTAQAGNAVEIYGQGEIQNNNYGIVIGNTGSTDAGSYTGQNIGIHNMTIEGNYQAAIWAASVVNLTIRDNYLEVNGSSSIILGANGNTNVPLDTVICNNWVYENPFANTAVRILHGENTRIFDNLFYLTQFIVGQTTASINAEIGPNYWNPFNIGTNVYSGSGVNTYIRDNVYPFNTIQTTANQSFSGSHTFHDLRQTDKTTNYVPRWTANGSLTGTGTIYDTGAVVGIGTPSPTSILHIFSAIGGGNQSYIVKEDTTADLNGTYVAGNGVNAIFGTVKDGFAGFQAGGIIDVNVPNANLYFATNDSPRMMITNSGQVGINTTLPDSTSSLTVNVGANTYALRVDGPTNLGGNQLFHLDNAYDIGLVGSNRPRTLYAATSVVSPSLVGTSSWANTASIALNAVSASFAPAGPPTFAGKTNNYLPKWSSNTLTATSNVYDDGTNVGIGTTSPSGKLHVQTAVGAGNQSYIQMTDVTADVVGIFCQGVDSTILMAANKEGFAGQRKGGLIYLSGDNSFTIWTNDTGRFMISSSGEVGIGGIFPVDLLDVGGNQVFHVDNAYDIGRVSTYRPRTVYAGTSVVAPNFVGTASFATTASFALATFVTSSTIISTQSSASWASQSLSASYVTPAGADQQIQYNKNGVLSGDSRLLWNSSSNYFEVNHATIRVSNGAATKPKMEWNHLTNQIGYIDYDGVNDVFETTSGFNVTASWANNVLSASYARSASWAPTAVAGNPNIQTSDSGIFYPVLVPGSGIQTQYIDGGNSINWNAATNTLTAPFFAGTFNGNASSATSAGTATTATNATNVVVSGTTTNTEHGLVFTTAEGTVPLKRVSGTGILEFSFNPSNNTLTIDNIVGGSANGGKCALTGTASYANFAKSASWAPSTGGGSVVITGTGTVTYTALHNSSSLTTIATIPIGANQTIAFNHNTMIASTVSGALAGEYADVLFQRIGTGAPTKNDGGMPSSGDLTVGTFSGMNWQITDDGVSNILIQSCNIGGTMTRYTWTGIITTQTNGA